MGIDVLERTDRASGVRLHVLARPT